MCVRCRGAACGLLPHGCSGRRRARPPARLGVLTSFGAAPRSPPVPSGPSGALHTSGARSLMFSSARWLEARPGPAAAHGHRSQAHQSLRRPPHQWRLVADVWLGASSQGPPWPCHRPPAPRPGPATAHGHRSEAPPQPVGITGASRVAISGRSLVCCYKRRQSAVFFVWLSVPLLQTSSIRRLFR